MFGPASGLLTYNGVSCVLLYQKHIFKVCIEKNFKLILTPYPGVTGSNPGAPLEILVVFLDELILKRL